MSVIFIVAFAVSIGRSQSLSCDNQVSINVPSGTYEIAPLVDVGAKLSAQGADPRFIVTTLDKWPTLEKLVDGMSKECTSWQSPNGGVKANMLVFAVAPKERKMAIFYGPGYASALSSQVDRIKRDFMGPRFKGGDWIGGLAAGANQVEERIKASVDESNKPVTYTTTNQATDFSVLWWALFFVFFVGLGIVIAVILKKIHSNKQQAQQDAIAARSRAVDLLNDISQALSAYPDIVSAPTNIKKAASLFDLASRQLSTVAASISGDPTSEGMDESFYHSLTDIYSKIEQKLLTAKQYIDVGESSVTEGQTRRRVARSTPTDYPPVASPPFDPPAPPPAPAPVKETVVVHDNSNDFLTGMLINEALHSSERERHRDPEPEPEHHHSSSHRHYDDNSSSSSSSSSSDWGGSSSSFGGSSDWGGGSSDSGSGGGFGGDSSSF